MNDISVKQNKSFQLDDNCTALLAFLKQWDKNYITKVSKIDLFNPKKIKQWTPRQHRYFIGVFYHLRGHFAEFLWHLGSFAPSKSAKEMILANITDEFNGHGLSHEQLYHYFASAFEVDLTHELLDNRYYVPFAKDYIDGQLRWLRQHEWEERLTMFAAIERLDNVDYVNFRDVAIHMGTGNKFLTFFNVHINADHFENILVTELFAIWKNNSTVVKDVFNFVLEYQITMFEKFSKEIDKL